MIELAKSLYRKIKYSVFTTPQKENFNFHRKRQAHLIEQYLQQHNVRKIQIGAQSNSIAGWLNLDLLPKSHEVVYMDATKTFPFPSGSIDYIYTEHMIEHISFSDAQFMIAECFRVLKPQGRIRVSTPNLAYIVSLYQSNKTDAQKRYIEFSVDRYLKNSVPTQDVYVVNNFFRDWGHQFIHDYKSLEYLLTSSGFLQVKSCSVMESTDTHLQNLEQHGKEITPEFNVMESVIVEAMKP
jgi:predicted SAM-dependent methyltransferase